MLNFNVCNIANVGREIYVWHRIGKTLSLFKDKTFFPYFYQVSPTGIFKTIDNKKVNKVLCSRPSDVKNRRDENSYEADVLFTKRYIIDKITSFGKADLKYSFVDIEVLTKALPNYLYPEQPISCISCSNSYTGEIKTFYLKDYLDPRITVPNWDEPEKSLLNDFINFIRKEQFDLLLGWNFIEFDWRYLCARYKKLFGSELATTLSPINQIKYLGNSKDENSNLVPAGLSICDYLDFYKKIYRTKIHYSLDAIAQEELKETTYDKIDFSILSEKIKEKNINDVRRMIEIEKIKKIIDYYDELRRMSKANWEDLTWNSKILDMMLLSEAKIKGIILPNKHYDLESEEETFEGAYRRCDTGLYKNLWKLDLSSAYPATIINFCLDTSNIRLNEGIEINNVRFVQNNNTLLPSLARKLINKKDELKKLLKSLNPESEEYKDLQIKYDAVKGVVNSLFGVCALKIFRLFNTKVASSITFLIRDLLHYVEEQLQDKGIKVIYIDTDSVFIEAEENPKDLLNELVNKWAKDRYNKEQIGIEFDLEGQFDRLLIVALCHYKGYLKTKTGLKEEIKGIEVKRKDSTKFMQEFQNTLIEKILNEESKEAIMEFIALQKEAIKKESLINIGFPCKISSNKIYKSPPIFVRALEYTKEIINFDKSAGDIFYYIFIEDFGESIRKSSRTRKNKITGIKEEMSSEKFIKKDVLAFDNDKQEHIKNIDWNKVIERNIDSKVDKIFEAMKWTSLSSNKINLKQGKLF